MTTLSAYVRRAAMVVVLPILLAFGAGAPGAVASCASDTFDPDTYDVAFSGTAVEETRGYTRFEVDRVWVGPDLADEVWVLGGQEQPRWPFSLVEVSSSVDADFEMGESYVVGASADFRTDVCNVAAPSEVTVPDDTRAPVAGGATGADVPMNPAVFTALAASGLGLVVAGLVLLVRTRRRTRRRTADASPSAT